MNGQIFKLIGVTLNIRFNFKYLPVNVNMEKYFINVVSTRRLSIKQYTLCKPTYWTIICSSQLTITVLRIELIVDDRCRNHDGSMVSTRVYLLIIHT